MSKDMFSSSRMRYSIVLHGVSHTIDADLLDLTACGRQIDAQGDWTVDGDHYALCNDCMTAVHDDEALRRLHLILDAATTWAAMSHNPLVEANLRRTLDDYWRWVASIGRDE